jgi:sec-independent protein translocase protein TatA
MDTILNLPPSMLGFLLPGHMEWIVLLIIGLLVFGRRLPDVGRSVGRSIVEFKKGIQGIEDDIDEAASKPKQINQQAPRADLPADVQVGGEEQNPYQPKTPVTNGE